MDINFRTILIITGVIISIGCILPYFIDILKGTTKPRIMSWIIWSTLTSISCVAALIEHQFPTAILLFISSVETLLVVVLGWKNGEKKIERLDIVCLVGAIVGIIVWAIFNSPAAAVLTTIAIDIVGGIPTLVHSWKKPREETWQTFLLASIGALCTLLVVESWQITAFAYPLFLVLINLEFAVVVLSRRRYLELKH